MLPQPLHPAVVHFPIVLVTMLPLVAAGALLVMRRDPERKVAWRWVVVLAALLAGFTWLSVETGEAEEDPVEAVVPERVLHEHEEAGERFLILAGAFVVLAGAGLIRGSVGGAGRVVATVAAFGLLGAAVQVGHTGGELVYRHGAAAAHVTTGAPRQSSVGSATRSDVEEREGRSGRSEGHR